MQPPAQEVPDSIAPYCRSHNGVLLANHGALTWGKDPEQAYMRMESLEYYATVSMYTGHIIGQANELTCEQVDRLVDTRTRLGIQSGGRPVCRHAEAGEPRPCECGLCNLTPAALSELICHLIATLPEDGSACSAIPAECADPCRKTDTETKPPGQPFREAGL